MGLVTLSPPAVEPLTAVLVRQSARLDDAEPDTYLDSLIAAARVHVENFTRQRLITQTVRLTAPRFCNPMPLPIAPVQSISALRYRSAAGVLETLDAGAYRLVQSHLPWSVAPIYGTHWPVPRLDHDAVQIDIVVGFGDAASDVPAPILAAMHKLVAEWAWNREATAMPGAGAQELPFGVRAMLMPYVLWV